MNNPREAVRFAYPVFLDVHDAVALVVGGGPVGARKAAGLAAAGARVRMVAIRIADAVEREDLDEVHLRPFEPSDLDGAVLVIAATGDPMVDSQISGMARTRGIWVNAADQPEDCSFILPAITRSGPVTVAVSTDGTSPSLAQRLRDQISERLGRHVGIAARRLARRRSEVTAERGTTEGYDWSPELDRALVDADLQSGG